MIDLYLRPINYSISNIDQELAKLPLLIQQRIIKKKQLNKRIASLHGYLLLHQILQEQHNTSLDNLVFLESGKPILEDSNLFFNISHSQDLVGLVVSTAGAVGLDIEAFRIFENITSAFSFFSELEQQAILSASNPNEKLIEFWSKKEALIKLLGNQMFDIAAQTDVRFLSTLWLKNKYFFHSINSDFNGVIYVSSSFSSNSINLK